MVELSASKIDFGDVEVGTTTVKSITVSNRSPCPTYYQFEMADEGFLSSDKRQGFLDAFASVMVPIRFSPLSPMVYYKRLYCLLENHDAMVILL